MRKPFRVLVRREGQSIQECRLIDDEVWRLPQYRVVLEDPGTPEVELRLPRPADEKSLEHLLEPHLGPSLKDPGWLIAVLQFEDSESLEVEDVLAKLSQKFRLDQQRDEEPVIKRMERSLDKEIVRISEHLEATLSSEQVRSELRLGFGWSFGRWLADYYLNRFEQPGLGDEDGDLEYQAPDELSLRFHPSTQGQLEAAQQLRTLWSDHWGLWMPHITILDDPGLNPGEVWVEFRERVVFKGVHSHSEHGPLASYLDTELGPQRWRLLSMDGAQKLLERLNRLSPALGVEFERENIPLSALKAVLRELLREGYSVRDLATIGEAVLEAFSIPRNLEDLYLHTRRYLGSFLYHHRIREGILRVAELTPDSDQLLNESRLEVSQYEKMAALLREHGNPVVLTDPHARVTLLNGLSCYLGGVTVLAYTELEPGQLIKPVLEI